MLPGKDGFAVCRELRAISDVPIIMVTARREDTEEIRGFGFGADDISEDHERHIGLFLLGVLIIAGLAGGKAIAVRKKAQT